MLAGVYQWLPLKGACLSHCRSPLGFFSTEWREGVSGALRMGLRHGTYCVGCCWAMMLLMFAVGVMNVVWMAALGAVMTIEKVNTTTRFSRALGIVFILAGAALILISVAAHWPAPTG